LVSLSLFFLSIILFSSFIIAAIPTPTIQTTSEWKVTHTTDTEYIPYINNAIVKKTTIGLIPKSGSCTGLPATKRIYDLNGNAILDDKNKPIDLKCQSAKCGGANCYSITLTTAQAINIANYIKIGDNSTTYEWTNSTLYVYNTDNLEIEPFTIEVYCNDVKLESPDLTWVSEQPIDKGVKFSANIANFTCDGKLTFRQNKVSESSCNEYTYLKTCSESSIDYSDFEGSTGNNIINKTIVEHYPNAISCFFQTFPNIFEINNCTGTPDYTNINYFGSFTDLDPLLIETYSTSSSGYYNAIEATSYGIRNNAPVLFMDFNTPNETGNYVKDNSLYNNFGTNSGATYNSSGGYDGSGAYQFDGVDDFVNVVNAKSTSSNEPLTVSAWFKVDGKCTAEYCVISRRLPANGWLLGSDNLALKGNFSFNIYDGTNNPYTSAVNATYGVWYHVVGVYNLTHVNLYINGELKNSASTGSFIMPSSSDPIYIGRWGSGYMNGSIDQVQIWNRALSASEILNLYNGTRNNSNYIGKYSSQGDFRSLVFYNSTVNYWNTTFSLADTYSTRTGIVTTKNEINLSEPSLVSYWKLDGNYLDATGRNNGTAVNGVNNATGISSGAMRFDGVDDYVNVSDTDSWTTNFNGTHTISLWVYPALVSANGLPLLSKGYTYQTSAEMSLFLGSNGEIQYELSGTSRNGIRISRLSVGRTTVNSWNHIVVTYNGTKGNSSGIQEYLNGILQNTTASDVGTFSTLNNTNSNVEIGAMWRGELPRFMNGSIDEVLIYNKSLTASEIQQIYKSGLSQHANTNVTIQTRTASSYNTSDVGLVAMWGLNNDSSIGENATKFVDSTGRNNGTCSSTTCPTLNSSGIVGNAMRFDGVDDYVNVSNDINLPIASTAFWYKGFNSSAYNRIIIKDSTGDGADWFVQSWSGRLEFAVTTDGAIGNARYCLSNRGINDNNWHYFTTVYDGNNVTLYVDGVLDVNSKLGSTGCNSGTLYSGNIYHSISPTYIGRLDVVGTGYYANGSIDEVRIYNRSLSASEVADLYNLGSYHINWDNGGAWSSESVASDNVGQVTSSSGKFFQFRNNFYTNDTEVSSYLLNHSITFLSPNTPPTVTFNSQVPSDINLSYLASENAVNFTYNITALDPLGINILDNNSLILCHKTNSTTEDITQFMNGTPRYGYNCDHQQESNVSDTYLFQVKGNGVIPATYNIDEEVFEDTPHIFRTLTSANQFFSTTYLNVSNDTQYNLLEQMVNSTVGAGTMRFYACNNTYAFTNAPNLNSNCYEFTALSATQTYHHSHSNYSKHQVIPLVINSTSGTIGTVQVTETMHFINRGSNVGTWYIYQINQSARADTTRVSTNNGVTWTSPANTTDGHLHQFHVNETFYYYVCANNTFGTQTCSTVRSDRLEEAGLPPTTPNVYSPVEGTYERGTSLSINYTSCVSPNGYPIIYYNISLYNSTFGFNKAILNNNSLNLNYTWDTTSTTAGSYYVGVTCYDNQGQSSTGYSANFSLVNDATNPVLTIISPENTTYFSSLINVTGSCTDTNPGNIALSVDGGAYNTVTFNTTYYTTGYELWHNFTFRCTDAYANTVYAYTRFYVGSSYAYNQSCPYCTNFTEQFCPTGYHADGYYSNGTIKCTIDVDTNATTECPDGYFLTGSGTCVLIAQECPENYTSIGYYSNGSIKCRYLNYTTPGSTTTTGTCKLTKRIDDGYFPYGKFGCAIEFI